MLVCCFVLLWVRNIIDHEFHPGKISVVELWKVKTLVDAVVVPRYTFR